MSRQVRRIDTGMAQIRAALAALNLDNSIRDVNKRLDKMKEEMDEVQIIKEVTFNPQDNSDLAAKIENLSSKVQSKKNIPITTEKQSLETQNLEQLLLDVSKTVSSPEILKIEANLTIEQRELFMEARGVVIETIREELANNRIDGTKLVRKEGKDFFIIETNVVDSNGKTVSITSSAIVTDQGNLVIHQNDPIDEKKCDFIAEKINAVLEEKIRYALKKHFQYPKSNRKKINEDLIKKIGTTIKRPACG